MMRMLTDESCLFKCFSYLTKDTFHYCYDDEFWFMGHFKNSTHFPRIELIE